METVAVVGVGLIGASFGLALRRAGFAGRILGVSSPPAIQAGLSRGAISEAATLEQAAQCADLIYLAQPVDRLVHTLEILGPMVRADCLITDAGSTKAAIVEQACECLPADIFLGGHPLAGKEQRGAESAEDALFRHRPYVLTPVGTMTAAMHEFENWLLRMEARVFIMSAAEHDTIVALTSHLPQLLSTALSVTLANSGNPKLLQIFGPGLVDMTRLAISSPDVWNGILETNQDAILTALDAFKKALENLANRVEKGLSAEDLFALGRSFALMTRQS
ncbi:MAG: prephenate dehydrogenase/arogenate dehydrogenase family protein [Acidobacteriaceae bacterium]|nr:prephenate dehydrogenase/arogenate dehydrogenase family protein [Acidobacteriaceae bacterium]